MFFPADPSDPDCLEFYTGDPRRCPRHGEVTSSPDGMFDAPCGGCEMEMDDACAPSTPYVEPVPAQPRPLVAEDDILF